MWSRIGDGGANESVLKELVEDQLKEANLCLKQIEARIPELIEADKMFLQQLRNERRSKEEIKELYQPIVDEASDIRGHLAVFALKEIRAIDIGSEKLDWKEDIPSRLGSGAFAIVYQGKMRRQGKEQAVALKVCSNVLDFKNASLIMAEVELMRLAILVKFPRKLLKFFNLNLRVETRLPGIAELIQG